MARSLPRPHVWLGLLKVGATMALVASTLVLGCGRLGSRVVDLEAGRAELRLEAVVGETMNLLTACSLDEIEDLGGTSMSATEAGGVATWRVEFAVTSLPDGFRVDATLLDTETSEAMRKFTAWRGRT